MQRIVQNQRGVSILEAVLGAALLGVATLGVLGAFDSLQASQQGMNNIERAANLADEVRAALSTEMLCAANLGGTLISLTDSKRGVPEQKSIQFINSTGAPGAKILEVGQYSDSLRVSEMRIIPDVQISATKYSGVLRLSIETGGGLGGRHMIRTIPMVMTATAGGVLTSCSTSPVSDLAAAKTTCKLKSGGSLDFDAATGTCVVNNAQWISGTEYIASCPTGQKIPSDFTNKSDNCSFLSAPGYVDDKEKYCKKQIMADGTTHWMCPPPVTDSYDEGTSACRCSYAADVDPTGFQCTIRCQPSI